jgi:hypothetical protein
MTPGWPRYRRIEHERISLAVALDHVCEVCCGLG